MSSNSPSDIERQIEDLRNRICEEQKLLAQLEENAKPKSPANRDRFPTKDRASKTKLKRHLLPRLLNRRDAEPSSSSLADSSSPLASSDYHPSTPSVNSSFDISAFSKRRDSLRLSRSVSPFPQPSPQPAPSPLQPPSPDPRKASRTAQLQSPPSSVNLYSNPYVKRASLVERSLSRTPRFYRTSTTLLNPPSASPPSSSPPPSASASSPSLHTPSSTPTPASAPIPAPLSLSSSPSPSPSPAALSTPPRAALPPPLLSCASSPSALAPAPPPRSLPAPPPALRPPPSLAIPPLLRPPPPRLAPPPSLAAAPRGSSVIIQPSSAGPLPPPQPLVRPPLSPSPPSSSSPIHPPASPPVAVPALPSALFKGLRGEASPPAAACADGQFQFLRSVLADPAAAPLFFQLCETMGLSRYGTFLQEALAFQDLSRNPGQALALMGRIQARFLEPSAPESIDLPQETHLIVSQTLSSDPVSESALRMAIDHATQRLSQAIDAFTSSSSSSALISSSFSSSSLSAAPSSPSSPRPAAMHGPRPPPRSPRMPPPLVAASKPLSSSDDPDADPGQSLTPPQDPGKADPANPAFDPYCVPPTSDSIDTPNPINPYNHRRTTSDAEQDQDRVSTPEPADPYGLVTSDSGPSEFGLYANPAITHVDPYAPVSSTTSLSCSSSESSSSSSSSSASSRRMKTTINLSAGTSKKQHHHQHAASQGTIRRSAPKSKTKHAMPKFAASDDSDAYANPTLAGDAYANPDCASPRESSQDEESGTDDWEISISKCQSVEPAPSSSGFLYSSDSDEDDLAAVEHKAAQERLFWNDNFQDNLRALRFSSSFRDLSQKNQANLNLVHLSANFSYAAQTYGRIIISEVYVKPKKKTIKPASLGGQAGGDKYMVQGILFKFAIDSSGLFKGDNQSASKVAGHELKGLVAYFSLDIQEMNMPLMALVDYRGFRLIAMSMLPIGKESLIYGSNDAGRTVQCSNPAFNALMTRAGQSLNIRPHWCGWSDATRQFLAAAADVEGHQSADGKFYLLDFSRTLPPVQPDPRHLNGHLYQLFRPEFVKTYPKPLVSDAFSGFIMTDPSAREYNQDIIEATEKLKEVLIPRILTQIVLPKWKTVHTSLKTIRDFALSIPLLLHRFGINLRYLGLLFNIITVSRDIPQAEILSQLFLVEAAARVCKNILAAKLREKMRELKIPGQVPYAELTIEFTNTIFSSESDKFWEGDLRSNLERHFNFKFPEDEDEGYLQRMVLFRAPSVGSSSHRNSTFSGRYWLFKRFSSMSGLKWTEPTRRRFRGEDKWHHKQPVNFLDLEVMEETVKHMRIVSDAAGQYYLGCGQALEDQTLATELYEQARLQFSTSLAWTPYASDILLANAIAVLNHLNSIFLSEKRSADLVYPPKLNDLVQRVEDAFQELLSDQFGNASAFVCYAEFLERCDGKMSMAEHYFLLTLETEPKYVYGNLSYGLYLSRRGFHQEADHFLKLGTALDDLGRMPISPLTGKVPGSRIRVYFENVSFSFRTLFVTVCMTPQDIADRLVHGLIRNLGSKDDISPGVLLGMQRKFQQFVLYEKPGGDKPLRQVGADEKPWLIVERPGSDSQLHFKPPLGTVEASMDAIVSVSSISTKPADSRRLLEVLDSFRGSKVLPFAESDYPHISSLLDLIDKAISGQSRISRLCKSIKPEEYSSAVYLCFRMAIGIWGFTHLDCGCVEMSVSPKVTFAWRYENDIVSTVPAATYIDLLRDCFLREFPLIHSENNEDGLYQHSKRLLRLYGHIVYAHLDKLSILREYFHIACAFSYHFLISSIMQKSRKDDSTTLDPLKTFLKA